MSEKLMIKEKFSAFLKTEHSDEDRSTTVVHFLLENDDQSESSYFVSEGHETSLKIVNGVLGKTEKSGYVLSPEEVRKALKTILLVKRYKVLVHHRSNDGEFEVKLQASPDDTSSVDNLIFRRGNEEASGQSAIMALHLSGSGDNKLKIGVCLRNEAYKTFQFSEFDDNSELDVLQAVLVQLSPESCLLVDEEKKMGKVKDLMKKNGVKLSTENSFSSEQESQKRNLKALALNKHSVNEVLDFDLALKAFEMIIKHFRIDVDAFAGQYLVQKFEAEAVMALDAQVLAGLDIFGRESAADMSLHKILNKCRTAGGQRALDRWLRQPLTDPVKIRERLNVVELFVENSDIRTGLHDDLLRKIPDFERLAIKLIKKKITLGDLYKIYVGVQVVKKMLEDFLVEEDLGEPIKSKFVQPLKVNVNKMGGFLSMIETSLDFGSVESGEFLVKSSFDDDLAELKEQLDETKSEIEKSASKVASNLGLAEKKSSSSLKLEWSANLGYYFRVTLKDEIVLRKKGNITVIDSTKSGVKFRNDVLTALNKTYGELKESYSEKQKRIIDEIIEVSFGYKKFILGLGELLSQLDVLVSFALVSISAPTPYVKPEILDDDVPRELIFEQMRHPVMEVLDTVSCFIPNDAKFNSEDCRFQIVTGPNLGGKSTYMRCIAVSTLMAHVGCFVPCSMARVSIIDKILVRIGASDCQLEGISTFMSEMLEASHILRSATEKSLIIIDEIGRGTSTYDGLGLAWAIADKIAKDIRSFTVFATHFFELTKLGSEIPSIKNFHVTALTQDGKFTLLYQVQEGVSDKSFGIEVAKVAQFPQAIIDDAEQRLRSYEQSMALEKYFDGDLSEDHYKDMETFISEFESKKKEGSSSDRKRLLSEMKQKLTDNPRWAKLLKLDLNAL